MEQARTKSQLGTGGEALLLVVEDQFSLLAKISGAPQTEEEICSQAMAEGLGDP